MFKSKRQSLCLLLLCFGLGGVQSVAGVEPIKDPMKPPAFALNKFRLEKLKKNAGPQTVKKNVAATPIRKTLTLSSILIGKNRKVAIINDKTLVVGERIAKYKLVAIFKDRVQMVSASGKRTELKLDNNITAIRKDAVESKL